MLLFNYGEWTYWDTFPQKVTFDGPNKLIRINLNEPTIDVQVDIYSNWKEWTQQRDNSKFEEAISAIGGDPITDVQSVGITYFLENGWRIKVAEYEHNLQVDGNLYTREPGADPYIEPDGNFKVTVSTNRSNLVDIVTVEGGGSGNTGVSNTDIQNIAANTAQHVWDYDKAAANTANSMGEHVRDKLLKRNEFIALD